jgi:integrase
MFRSHHLQRRANGIFYFRFYVPTYLVGRFKRREIVRSLRTRDLLEAERRLTLEKARIYRVIDMARALSELNQAELEAAAVQFFERASKAAEAERLKRKFQLCEIEHEVTHHVEMIEHLQEYRDRHHFGPADEAVQAICEHEGIIYESDTDNYRSLAHLTLRAQIEIEKLLCARTAGEYDAKPKDRLFLEATPEAKSESPKVPGSGETELSLREICDRFLEHNKAAWADKTAEKYKANLDVVCLLLGEDTPLSEIAREQARYLRDNLVKLPANFAKRYPDRSIDEVITIAEEANEPGMKPGSVKAYLGTCSSLFSWAEKEGYVDSNPIKGITVPDPVSDIDKRHPFSTEHLQSIFDAPTYMGMHSAHYWKRSGDVILKDARYWLPVAALFTGMRLGELVGLKGKHCQYDEGIFYLDIEASKTRAGIRKVPIHPFLATCDFLGHLDGLKDDDPVFGDIEASAYGKHFARFLDSLGISNPGLVFHSFRHTFADALRRARIEEPLAKALLGHAEGSVTGQYGAGYPLPALYEAMSAVEYPGLNLDHIMS